MSFQFAGIATAVPEHSIRQEDAAQHSSSHCCESEDDERRLRLLYRRSGVKSRGSTLLVNSIPSHEAPQSFFLPREVMPNGPTTAARMRRYEQDALPLAIQASRGALEDGGIRPHEVTHLVTVSCTGFSAPGLDVGLIRSLALPASTQRTHVGFMGCHGALNGLRLANAYATADPTACVLLCAVELCSLHHQYGWRADRVLSNALFADGAAAAVGRASRSETNWRIAGAGSMVLPQTDDLMSWTIRDHGFEMTLSSEVPAIIEQHLWPWLAEWLARQNCPLECIQSWAVHPGGPKILQSTAEALGIDRALIAESDDVLAQHGNMSSPTILFILDRLRRKNAPRPCVALAFGPGLTIEATLIV